MRWLALYLPQWELDYVRHSQALPHDSPLALYDVSRARVIKVCRLGASLGVKAGQSMGSATQLCPALQPIPFEMALHRQGCDWLCRHSYSFSARVVPPPEPDSYFSRCRDVLLLEVGSMSKLFGGEEALGRALSGALVRLGCHFALAFGDTPLSAGVLARCAPVDNYNAEPANASHIKTATLRRGKGVNDSAAGDRLGCDARVGTVSSNPSFSRAISTELSTLAGSPLHNLPLHSLPLPEELLQRLEGMGLETIGALIRLPARELGIRFGPELVQLLGRLSGRLAHPQCFYSPVEQYCQRLELMYEAASFDALVFVLGRMFAELSLFLRQRQLAVSQLELLLHYRVCAGDEEQTSVIKPEEGLTLAYPFAEFSTDGLLALCRLQLERFTLVAPVVALTLHHCQFVPRSASPAGALEDGHRASLSLFARLEARLGPERIKRLGARAALLPEQGIELLPMSAAIPNAHGTGGTQFAGNGSDAGAGLALACRPPWLLPRPEPIDEASVLLLRGPERLREPWWQPPCSDKEENAAERQGGDSGDSGDSGDKDRAKGQEPDKKMHNDRQKYLYRECQERHPLPGAEPPSINPRGAARDYYLARHLDGGLCWVFRREGESGLYLQGWF